MRSRKGLPFHSMAVKGLDLGINPKLEIQLRSLRQVTQRMSKTTVTVTVLRGCLTVKSILP